MANHCPRCDAANPDGKKFCGDCGAALGDALEARVRQAIDAAVETRVQTLVQERFKDQKLLEVETTQAIAERFSQWAKVLGFFVGIPVALLLVVLAVLGVSTYADFSKKVETIETDTLAKISAKQQQVEKLNSASETLVKTYEDLKTRLENASALADQVQQLSERVDKISERLNFTTSSHVSDAVKKQVNQAFADFQRYVQGFGYRPVRGQIEVDVRDNLLEGGTEAYYDSDKQRMVIDSKYVGDASVLNREYMHHVLYSAGMPQDEKGKFWAYYAIESGLAWYFPCSFLGKPNSPSARWNLATQRSFAEIRPDVSSAMMDGTEIWGAAFWELRQAFGQPATDKLLYRAWLQLHPEDVQTDRGASFEKLLLADDPAHADAIRQIFARRGLTP